MLSGYTNFLFVVAFLPVFVGLFLGVLAKSPNKFLLVLLVLLEVVLLGQLVVVVVELFSGVVPVGDIWEIFGYILVALLMPLAGIWWAMLERTRWSSFILALIALVIVVMGVRITQIWYGVGVGL